MVIVSVSRRCDIPRFQFGWFLQRLEAGYVDVANPFNAAQIKRVSLKPEDVDFLVFWTRDPRPLLAEPEKPGDCYTMITLTGYPEILEPNAPPREETMRALRALAALWGRKRVIWRYDPIFLSSLTDAEFHRRNFADLAGQLAGAIDRVIISVYDEYAGARWRLSALEKNGQCQTFPHYTDDGLLAPEAKELVAELARIATRAGMDIRSCAEGEECASLGIQPGACIDGALIAELLGSGKSLPDIAGRDKNQRHRCRCAPSVDIGSYGDCPAACVYCYARRSFKKCEK